MKSLLWVYVYRKDRTMQVFFYKEALSLPLFFFVFIFSTVNSKNVHFKKILMAGFEPWTSGI